MIRFLLFSLLLLFSGSLLAGEVVPCNSDVKSLLSGNSALADLAVPLKAVQTATQATAHRMPAGHKHATHAQMQDSDCCDDDSAAMADDCGGAGDCVACQTCEAPGSQLNTVHGYIVLNIARQAPPNPNGPAPYLRPGQIWRPPTFL